MSNKVIDTIILTMYVLLSLFTIAFVAYAGYCVLQTDNATAMTSVTLGVVSFALSVFIAKVFEV